jgi:hypothetical protein
MNLEGAVGRPWRDLRFPAAMEVLPFDVTGRDTDGAAAAFPDGVKWQDLLRMAAVGHAAYLGTEAGTTWRVRRVYGPAVFVVERLWGDDPALRSL